MRVAAIDIGTNTTLLLVAERDAASKLVAVREEATITRLGEGVDVARVLKPEAVARTNACLEEYARIVLSLGVTRVAVVGTSAMRDAGGGEAVRAKVRELFGVDARTISGDDEAKMTFHGALSGLTMRDGDVAVFDIGGGSTEIVEGSSIGGRVTGVRFAHSFDMGSVRMTERHIRNDPPTSTELLALRTAVRASLAGTLADPVTGRVDSAAPKLVSGTPLVGIAGTITTLVAIALELDPYDGGRVHGHTLSLATIDALTDRLASVPLESRARTRGLQPKRADVIIAGAIIASEVCRALGVQELTVSDRGVRWGLAEELL